MFFKFNVQIYAEGCVPYSTLDPLIDVQEIQRSHIPHSAVNCLKIHMHYSQDFFLNDFMSLKKSYMQYKASDPVSMMVFLAIAGTIVFITILFLTN